MSYEETVIDFSQVDPATQSKFIEPGMYRLKVDAENVKVEAPANKTPYLSVKFISETGDSVIEKFYLTAKVMPRFQYLHEGWFNKKLDKKFTSMLEVGEYFKKALTSKIVTRMMVVGGKIAANGNFYSGLPYTGFIIANEKDFVEGAFDKDSTEWRKVVTVEKANPALINTDAAVLPGGGSANEVEDSPWS